MSQLMTLIDEYKDAHGAPSDSSIARAIGVAPQTISSWRRRGIRDVPNTDRLRDLARFIGRDYGTVVLRAALIDAGLAVPGDFPADAEAGAMAATGERDGYTLAARTVPGAVPELKRQADEQDAEAYAPDPEGPEGGA